MGYPCIFHQMLMIPWTAFYTSDSVPLMRDVSHALNMVRECRIFVQSDYLIR